MKKIFTLLFIAAFATVVNAQKKSLSPEDFNSWNYLSGKSITDDGLFVMWYKSPQEGDKTLYVYNTNTEETLEFNRASNAFLTKDNNYLVFKVSPEYEEVRELKRKKTKRKDMPKDKLVIYKMASGVSDTIADIKSFSMPAESGNWLAVNLEELPKVETPPLTEEEKKAKEKAEKKAKKKKEKQAKKKKKNKKGEAEEKPAKKKKSEKPTGNYVRLINLEDDSFIDIKWVDDFFMPDFANQFYYLRNIGDSLQHKGLFSVDLATSKSTLIDSAFKSCDGVSLNKRGTKLAYLTTQDSAKADIQYYTLKLWDGEKTVALLDTATAGLPEGWMPSADFRTVIDENNNYLLVGTKPIPTIYPEDTMALDEEKVRLDIWNWQDEEIQPMQKLNVRREAQKSYLGRIKLSDNSFVQLGNEEYEIASYPRDTVKTYVTAYADKPYRKEASWLIPTHRDVALVNIETGKFMPVQKSIRTGLQLSPDENYAYWFDRATRHWYAYNIATGKTVNLSKNIKYPVWNESNDIPDEPTSYAAYGWIADSLFVFTDKYDIWAVNPMRPGKPKCLTKEMGRKSKTEYGFIYLSDQDNQLNKEWWLLSTLNDETKEEGYVSFHWETGETKVLVAPSKFGFGYPSKAKDADKLIFTKGNYEVYPELYISNTAFASPKKLTDTNPQQADFKWGTVEMVEWKAYNGKMAKGLLYKPEDFDETKKYPMLVYFYETSSERIFSYKTPAPSASVINFPYFISHDYLIFVPDIHYKTGQPGQDAYDYIVSGAKEMAKNAWVDEENMAIQGQSWGGYQVAYLVTKTNMFKCAMAGAPVSNMTSAYGGIRWGSGMSREFQYERTQSRLGATLWENREVYIKNSPVFFADKVETPLLMMHNDDDGAVPWYQGIEYFMALRRLGKPTWMLVYNGEQHNLMKRHNRKDLSQRMAQFFDHYLKGAPAPEWMEVGRPAIEKDDNPGFNLMAE